MIGAYTTEFRRLRRATTRKPAGFFAALVVFIIVILVAAPQAQQQSTIAGNTASSPVATPRVSAESSTDIDLLVGRSTILNVGSPITRVSLTVPDIADALVTGPTQLLIHGKQPGTISLFVWDRGGSIKTFEVNVRRDLKVLVEQVKHLFPGEPITVAGSGKDVVLSGTVSSTYVREKSAELAAGYVEKKENVVNLLRQREGVSSNQVLLRVRFAEVSRNALQELGASLFMDGRDGRWGRTTTQQFNAPFFDIPEHILGKALLPSDYLNLFLFDNVEGLGAMVKALQGKGLFQSLAEPNLVALNGKEASFLAGGEFPIPVVQGAAGSTAVTIMFKEFGVRLNFTPTVLGGDLIHLKLKPEVSALDFNNAIVIEGFRIPALTSRRAETEVELRDGQTFAIAGLMNNTATSSMRKVPGIGDIPILGMLFRSRAYQKDQTELIVMVTPHILRRDSTGVSEGLPSLVEPFLSQPDKRIAPPAPYTGSPRYPSNEKQKYETTPAPVPAPEVQNAPVQQSAPAQSVPVESVPVQTAQPAPIQSRPVGQQPAAAPVGPTKEQLKAIERAREEERLAAAEAERLRMENERREAEERRAAEAVAARERAEQARKDEAERQRTEKLEKERAKREAEVAKRNSELARKKAEEDQKREKALTDAAARLKAAQAAYQSELDKAKGGSNDKKNPGGSPR
jgi:pilus assembly protein CpaC